MIKAEAWGRENLTLRTKLSYGTGMLAASILGNILIFFLLFFMTDVAGLNPALAGSVLLLGRLWDAVNDPMVGWLSDRTQSRWGRRYPWMVAGAIPFAGLFILLWLVPPVDNQWQLFGYYAGIAFLYYIASTTVSIPYTTLASELTHTYTGRTSLASFQTAFDLGGGIFALVMAQVIFERIPDTRQQYIILAIGCSVLAVLAVLLCVWGTYPCFQTMQSQRSTATIATTSPLISQVRTVLSNRAFLMVMGIFLCSWLAMQLIASVLPYFVVHYMGRQEQDVTKLGITAQLTALAATIAWSWLGHRFDKRTIYFLGIPPWILAQAGIFFLQPQQIGFVYVLAVTMGVGISVAYLVPWSTLPDVIDLDELQSGQRREGIFYGFMSQMQKIGVAVSLFLVGKSLDWSGFIATTAEQPTPTQPESALWTIRWAIAPVPALLLLCSLILAYFYPITREAHQEILLKLRERHNQPIDPV
jgi:GPH family glycoside/pentoside/hexuronide:cation symporter